jgi:hypothetical protein
MGKIEEVLSWQKTHQTYKPARKEIGERLVTQNTMLSNHDASKRSHLM